MSYREFVGIMVKMLTEVGFNCIEENDPREGIRTFKASGNGWDLKLRYEGGNVVAGSVTSKGVTGHVISTFEDFDFEKIHSFLSGTSGGGGYLAIGPMMNLLKAFQNEDESCVEEYHEIEQDDFENKFMSML